ncbi:2-oxoglutarate dehydrogenase, E2 component, dihydrolipoamide succinyltransferase [Falsarthrobacter nasiphocae]|uniref:Dihydrolipoamide acetyltransferase component of pyruvate dehydrogenase complex n=1 Tax=Falsarthrobacter nasiphocae TaxID=189863 RepID=A0AAE3YGD3_9MICC|nr:2-oxoglutarate dehydrogenase, E2 component, dihydrolipoamide succinyltransferase [Falsarthrobacter nasiphocae]MDR6891286.1 2-oxoglutarate dehydrogenase E2 component (dihydrolipoamide succinyltransferase) [Falsarthrobacter nasiphocae]
MSEFVNLPALGESVTEGTVTRWLKSVGDTVEVDEPIVEVSTDKVDTEVPSPIAGTIEEILVDEDETVEVGAPLVKIGDGSGSSAGESDAPAAEESSDDEATKAAEAKSEEPTAESADEPAEKDESSTEAQAPKGGSGEGTEVTLPALGESVTEGTVTRWLKSVGDSVEVDEPLLEVSTDKVDTEVPSPVAGTLLEVRADEDETVEVGAVLAVIGDGSAAASSSDAPKEEPKDEPKAEKAEEAKAAAAHQEAPKEEKKAEAPKAEPKAEAPAPKPAASSEDQGEAGYVTPIVRKLAKQQGVDLSTVKGTGVGGRIRKEDVEKAAEAAASAPAATSSSSSPVQRKAPEVVEDTTLRGTTQKAPRIRQVIARRMRESLDISTQLTQVQEIDMTRVAKLRNAAKTKFQQENGTKLTFLPFIAKAVAEALKQHPKLNAEYNEDSQEITYHNAEHLAIAVDTEKGLLVPVIQDAGQLNLAGIAGKIADVAARTRSGKIGPDELSGGTFSITNIGSVGALFDTPIINQPQVAILGTGAIVKRPVVVTTEDGEDQIAIRHMMYLSLTYDHRLVDGADAGRFLQTLKARLEGGAFESELGL